MTAFEERRELMKFAQELAEERATLLKQVSTMYNKVISRLVSEADGLATEAAGQSPESPGGPSAEQIADFETPGRKCSNCGQAGHNARTCLNRKPEATEKKKRKPLTEESKKQARENLKKARAAKGKK